MARTIETKQVGVRRCLRPGLCHSLDLAPVMKNKPHIFISIVHLTSVGVGFPLILKLVI